MTFPVEVNWYDIPLYYDIIFDSDTDIEADFLEQAFQKHATVTGKRALEPACGSGRLLLELGRRGWHCSGLDQNQNMLDFASARLEQHDLEARLFRADMSDFSLAEPSSFELAFCLVSTFKYLLTEAEATGHLHSVARALKPGGIYVLGFHLTPCAYDDMELEQWSGSRDGVEVQCVIESSPPNLASRREDMRSRLHIKECEQTRVLESHWQFRTYDLEQLTELFARVPELEHIATYDFNYDINDERQLDQELIDAVFILRRV